MIKWERPLCNNCHNKSYTVIFDDITSWEHRGKFRVVKCKKCGLMFLHPRPTKKYIGKFYPEESYWNSDINPDKAFGYIYNLILKEKTKGKILDIGAGNGLLLTKFKKKEGWKVSGVELSKHAVGVAKKRFGITLKKGDFLDYKYPSKYFDVVVLNNVLEHLYKPKETLKKISKVIRDDGVLVIAVPNMESVGLAIFRENWHALQPPRHLYHFSPATLSQMLKDSGFKDIKIYHNYWEHNYYSLFESFRFLTSSRFRKSEAGGLKEGKVEELIKPSKFSFIKEIGKAVAKIFANTIAFIEPFWEKGEVVTIYAKKS